MQPDTKYSTSLCRTHKTGVGYEWNNLKGYSILVTTSNMQVIGFEYPHELLTWCIERNNKREYPSNYVNGTQTKSSLSECNFARIMRWMHGKKIAIIIIVITGYQETWAFGCEARQWEASDLWC